MNTNDAVQSQDFSPNILLKMIFKKIYIRQERRVYGSGATKMCLKNFKVEKRHSGALKKPIILNNATQRNIFFKC